MMLDNAREHGVDGARRRPRPGRDLRGRRAPSASTLQETADARGPRQGRRRRQRPERPHCQSPAPARLGSGPQQGRDLDLLGRRLSRHRPRRGRDDGAADAGQAGLVLVHPAARQHRQRRRRRRRSTTCSRTAARTSSRSSTRKSSGRRRSRSASTARRASTGYFATKDYSYRTTQGAGDGWVLVGDAWGFLDPLYSSGVLLALKSGELAADAIVEGLKKGDTSGGAARHVGAGLQPRRRPHAPAGLRVLRRLQLRPVRRKHPELRGTVTDLLIGDLFTDRVDTVWAPMEAMYPDNRHKIPRGTPARRWRTPPKRPTS